jgi:hypothetical protein
LLPPYSIALYVIAIHSSTGVEKREKVDIADETQKVD